MAMKKIVVVFIVSLLSLTMLLCACSSNGEKNKETIDHSYSTVNGKTCINSFETQKDLNSVMSYSYFGKVDLETENKNYIKDGDASAKLTLFSDRFGNTIAKNPCIYQSMRNVYRNVDKTDFANVKSVECDIYNAQDVVLRVGFRLVYYRNYDGGMEGTTIKYYDLAPNAWTPVSYDVTQVVIPERTTAAKGDDRNEGEMVKLVIGVDFVFNRPVAGVNDQVFYLDNVRVCE